MVGLTQELIEKLSRPIIKVLRGAKEKDLRRTLTVKCYTIKNINREEFLKKLKQYGEVEVNIVDWNYLTLFEVKGVDPLDLQNLIGFMKKTLTLN